VRQTVYLLHFDRPFHHARHYIGYTQRDDVAERLAEHVAGRGANLVKHAINAGITVVIARVWQNVSRGTERKKKNQGGAARICPICKAERME
jgi:predicted GIY-YIG superfamily endonuclease